MNCGSSSSITVTNDIQSTTNIGTEKSDEKSFYQESQIKSDHQESQITFGHQELQGKTNQLNLSRLTSPDHISYVKPGHTLCCNKDVILTQDGSTTIEFRLFSNFQPKKVPWRFGLIRDIVWCSDLNIFILLTKDALFSVSPNLLLISEAPLNKPLVDITINRISEVKPYAEKALFWRCTCAGTILYISYSGNGTVIDEYSLKESSCEFVKRWRPPKTCATYEGIWCIRHRPDTNQFAFTIMNKRNHQWRVEIRSRDKDKFSVLRKIILPLIHGDCEIFPLPTGEWLIINGGGLRLIHITKHKLKAVVEYARELRNALLINNFYFIVRTKRTLEIHKIK